jgi:hypothetical protein
MTTVLINNNVQPHEHAFNQQYFINTLTGSKHGTAVEAKKSNPMLKAIVEKLRPSELDYLIQMIDNIR